MKATAVTKQLVLKAEKKQEQTSLLVYLCHLWMTHKLN